MIFLSRNRKLTIKLTVAFALLGIFSAAASSRLIELTSTPEFCNTCHVMNEPYEAWFLTGVHRNIRCVDCHLPNDHAANHLLWKGIDGSKDVLYFHSGLYVEPLEISDRGKRFVRENCVRCHKEMVSRIEADGKDCWSCHRRINHKAAIFRYHPN